MTSKMGIFRLFICLGVILHIGPLFSSATSPGIEVVFNKTYSGSVSAGNDVINAFTYNTSNVPYRKLRQSAVIEAVFNETYSGSVSAGNDMIYTFTCNPSKDKAIRFHFLSDDAVPDFPVLLVVKRSRSVLSWTVPYVSPDGQKYGLVSKTLCPDSSNQNTSMEETITVVVSTSSAIEVNFSLTGMFVDNFNLQSNTDITFSSDPSSPQYYQYEFPEGVNMVLVRAKSTNETCAYFSVQKAECPIFEDVSTVRYNAGTFQTMTLQAAITVTRDMYTSGLFYIVVVVHPNDNRCVNNYKTFTPLEAQYKGPSLRTKIVTLTVEYTLETHEYWKPILITVAVYLAIYALSGIFIAVYFVRQKMSIRHAGEASERHGDSQTGAEDGQNEADRNQAVADAINIEAIDNAEICCVSDLSKKDFKEMEEKYNTYVWNIVTVSVFYALPVVQLVITYQVVTNVTGNQDSCYYNFLCAKPYGWFSAFNNVFSNIGYVMLGFFFIVLVGIKHCAYKKRVKNEKQQRTNGIPKHYGLLYALGFALIMEGVMSGSYHVCPNRSNFQFDTTYMYMMACLGILTAYQQRHTDITASSKKSFASFGLIVLIGFLALVFIGSIGFYVFFFVVHMLTYVGLSSYMYCRGTIKPATNLGILKRICDLYRKAFCICKSELCECKSVFCVCKSACCDCKPETRSKYSHLVTVFFLIVGFIGNLAWSIFVGLRTRPLDFASHLLVIMIGNMAIYLLYYYIMKCKCGECIRLDVFLLLILMIILWAVAARFFKMKVTGWEYSAARSRDLNRDCTIMGFYDEHDIWHLISALALFVSFVGLLLVDDNMDETPQNDILVF